jgi:F420-dependent oxidoreductase-like protein
MLEVAIMIEGQNGLTWPRWQAIARAVEDLGFAGLYRSDHFTNANPPDIASLELWVSLTWLASHTSRIEFGPLVSPLSFRHPAFTARFAAAVDDLSHGRLWLGLGAGWQEREHHNFGFDLLDIPGRFRRFEEGLQIIQGLLKSDTPLSFQGEFFTLREAILLPRPHRPEGPPLLIGGNGRKRTLPLVARYAREWNAIFLPSTRFRELNLALDELAISAGRSPQDVRRSMMTGLVYAPDSHRLDQNIAARTRGSSSAADLLQRGLVVGTPGEVTEQLGVLAEAGVQRVMLQWLDLDDLDGLESFGARVLAQIN